MKGLISSYWGKLLDFVKGFASSWFNKLSDHVKDMPSSKRYIVLALIAILVLILIFSRALTRRLRTLLDGIRSMRDGEYGSMVAPKGHDELTEIFNEFNHMSGRLRDTEELRRTFVSDADLLYFLVLFPKYAQNVF